MDPVSVHEPHILALPATMHALNEDPTKDAETAVSSDAEDHLPALAKAHKHLSHVSADSVATTAFDDDEDHGGRLSEHHRRSHSGSDSLCSVVTEATEQEKASPATTTTSTTVTTMAESPADKPDLSVLTDNHSSDHNNNSAYLPINRDEQLDPWGSNPYDQEDLASTLRFSRRPGDELDEDELAAEEERDKIAGLTLKTTALTSPTTARPLSASMGGAGPDALERLDREFEMLTNGQAIQITTTAASSPLQLEFDREQLEDPRGIMERSISDKDKKIKLSKMFSRAASNGDMNRIADMLDNFRDWIDIEAQDEDGTSPLIYAACFGHVEIAFMLLEAGAAVDARDKFGWTALVWATNNKHDNMVRLLLEHGASTSAQTAKGHTIVDFLRHDPNDNTKIVQIFQEPGRRDSISSNGSLVRTNNSSLGDDLFYQAGIEGFEEMMAENERRYRMAMDSANAFDVDMADLSLADQPQLDDEGEFDWERCLPDQMFVFSSKDIGHIIETTITNMEPTRSRQHRPIPAYVLFLAARFAHYFSSPELLDELLEATTAAITNVTHNKPEDMTLTAYWISNTSVLLHFLRKDPGLGLASGFHQVKIEALIQDMLQMLVMDAERRIEKILEPAMLDHDTIQGLDEVKFQSDWAFLWRGSMSKASSKNSTVSSATGGNNTKRSSSPLSPNLGSTATFNGGSNPSPSPRPLTRTSSQQTVPLAANRPPSPRQRRISPRTITTMLSSLLFVMQTYDIHPDIVHYVIAQLLHYVSCEVFNRMMLNKKMLSRSKALQTRLNLSILEDWIRLNNLPTKLTDQFAPLVQLLQLLQVLSLQEDFPTWIETLKKLELLNPTQVKRVVSAYRFEVNEPRLGEEITQYVLQIAADTERMVRRQMMDRKRERPLTMMSIQSTTSSLHSTATGSTAFSSQQPSGDLSDVATARTSISTEATMSSVSPALLTEAEKARAKRRQREQEEEANLLSETRNSKAWLPFAIPENMAEREHGLERVFVPLIPEEMMSLLDTYSS
ncbi:uncharacterized protein EMPS_05010 [Entomortierella parvispora]|uniref:Dilute domain-containing protein n=1 Tax=Entomortierella parvispora TaxID=205924 RepID=A0A9P3LW26_9FUNG|nr:uncharacterized protein EMPS_05010 [Entomortierella parvispora]